jgi:plastocyanin
VIVQSRRRFLRTGGLALAGLGARAVVHATDVVRIEMRATARGEDVWFDPIGVLIAPGQTVRWVLHHDVHTTTAYHPNNDRHSLRIPETAEPWDSAYLVKPGTPFDVRFIVEGIYDYYCIPHEAAGMVGRIIVGRPGGPGALGFDAFTSRPGAPAWKPVPEAARRAFPDVQRIMRDRVVRRASV